MYIYTIMEINMYLPGVSEVLVIVEYLTLVYNW